MEQRVELPEVVLPVGHGSMPEKIVRPQGWGMDSRRSLRALRWIFPSIVAVVLILAGALVLAQPARAQAPTPSDDQVNAIARQLYCPVCENVPLDVCPTQACAQWRETIREKLTLGWTEQQIKDYFVQQYGARVLATPPASGFNWLAYVLPPVAFLAGAFILGRALRSWRRSAREAAPAAPPPPADDPYVARLEEELRRRA